jgi:hypothetical protein
MKLHYLKAALALAVIPTVGMDVSAQETQKTTDWREDYAYSLGVPAYIQWSAAHNNPPAQSEAKRSHQSQIKRSKTL